MKMSRNSAITASICAAGNSGRPKSCPPLTISMPIERAFISPGEFGASIVARMKDGVTREQLAAELKLNAELGFTARAGE